ncbi:polysaccharide biosynthesis protein [Faecalibaculum rodentium]|uniref:polysaccharide biosynthesis protein n=1 Tax=Faecalibaculum rodentium TaxID=1702221 RepID=UPI003C6D375B
MEEMKEPTTNQKKNMEHWKLISAALVIYDIFAVNFSYFVALWMRFDLKYSAIPKEYLSAFVKFAPIYTVLCILVFWFFRLYRSLWRFASYKELVNTAAATVVTTVIQVLGITFLFHRMPFSYYLWGTLLQFILTLGIRFSYRFYLLETKGRNKVENKVPLHPVMIVGAGNAGHMILRDINKTKNTRDEVLCFIDDNSNKWGRFIDGVPIEGGRDEILPAVEKYGIEKIYIAIPSASRQELRDLINICKETGCQIKNLPALYQLVTGEISVSRMKDVAIEDLLGRDPIKTDLSEVFSFLNGKTVLITGGGGSIGSELARQVASHQPKLLVLFDIYENNIYNIQQELRRKYKTDLNMICLIGSVRDSRRIWDVMETYKPDVVFHAAAHKHVPLMEVSPCEAIKNNSIGTYKTAYAAMANGVKRFVLISTDKAVNPTNVMGATKRMCEMILQTFDQAIKEGWYDKLPQICEHDQKNKPMPKPETQYVAVRFGNVLGSNGSVIPLFKEQIAAGGPVTVTHPDIIRYFMTIPEAVSLVLQAGYYAKGGEIFILDMGEPVKIDDLAKNLIKLSGLKPNEDIQIVYSGLRPGEKLYEEKLMAEEGLQKTRNDLIHIANPIMFDKTEFLEQLGQIIDVCNSNDVKNTIRIIEMIVTTYKPECRDK